MILSILDNKIKGMLLKTMTFPSSPAISVCIPTYCGAAYIGAAIESVLNQNFSDFELIIIDNNSPDQTYEVVSQFHDERIRYIKNSENLGPEGNFNKCLAEARGKYFKLLPDDDTLAVNCLLSQIDVLENDTNHSIALVFCARHIIDRNGRVLTTRGYPGGVQGIISGLEVIKKCIRLGTNLLGEPGAVLFRKSLAEKTGYFDCSIPYIIDLDYWFRLLVNGDAYYIDEPLASFRVTTGSWSIDMGTRQSDDFRLFINRCIQNTEYKLTVADSVSGKFMAKINNYLRLLFYRFYLSN